jgi:diaminopimelate epimerase
MAKKIPFIKMHGAGNDFVFLDKKSFKGSLNPKTVRLLMDRHFGIGGDQLLFLNARNKKRPSLLIYNSDGSQAEMCGNGVRAVGWYLNRFRGFKKDFVLETKAGPIGILYRGQAVEVDMGKPIFEGERIPVKAKGLVTAFPFHVGGERFEINCVSMGNPHCVIFVKDVKKFPVEKFGPMIENHPFFPRRVNVEFVQILSKGRVRARVWERGAGETLACGTGACAIGVIGAWTNKTDRNLKVILSGGELGVRWAEDGHVFLTGPAEVTYEGEFLINSHSRVPIPK